MVSVEKEAKPKKRMRAAKIGQHGGPRPNSGRPRTTHILRNGDEGLVDGEPARIEVEGMVIHILTKQKISEGEEKWVKAISYEVGT